MKWLFVIYILSPSAPGAEPESEWSKQEYLNRTCEEVHDVDLGIIYCKEENR